MEEKQNNSTFKKVKLNYMHAVSRTPPKAKIKVSSAKIEELNKAIIEKTRQNNAVFNAARDSLEDDIYKKNSRR